MNNVKQFNLDTHRALEAYDDEKSDNYVNATQFEAASKYNDIWIAADRALIKKYKLPPFHLWVDGYVIGDAGDDGVKAAVKSINEIEGARTVTSENLFEFLDGKLIETLKPKVDKLIKEYNKFCEKALKQSQ